MLVSENNPFFYYVVTISSSSEALFAYWNKAAPAELTDFFTLLE